MNVLLFALVSATCTTFDVSVIVSLSPVGSVNTSPSEPSSAVTVVSPYFTVYVGAVSALPSYILLPSAETIVTALLLFVTVSVPKTGSAIV